MPGLMLMPFQLIDEKSGQVVYRGRLGTMGPISVERAYHAYSEMCAAFKIEPVSSKGLYVSMV